MEESPLKIVSPNELRIAARNSRLIAHQRPEYKAIYLKIAARYDRMADARETLWENYTKACRELEE